jgi:hypothetical protein
MNKTLLIVAGLVGALLIGRYMTASSSGATGPHPVAEPGRFEGSRPVLRTTGVFINGRELSRDQLISLAATYHYFPPAGRYWYDSISGAWGLEGRETAGFIIPGHNFGPLAENASRGNTGVFVNGRQLNLAEALSIQQNFGAVYRGRWWLDGRTGYYGLEGNAVPLGNLVALLRARQNRRGGDNFWCGVTACGNDNGQSGYVDVNGTIVPYDH